jgi:hypothetical protein
MAVVGEAHIIVRAITTSVKDDIKKGFNGVDDTIQKTGDRARKVFSDDFAKSTAGARAAFSKLVRTGYILQGALGTVAGVVGSLIGGLGALIGAAGGAAGSLGAFAGVLAALPAGMATFKLAIGGVGAAVSKSIQNNKAYSKSLQDARAELKEIAFDAEAAALSVRRAGLSLEQARENLLAAQQLPPNSRARREAELAYEEADLAYRRAMEQEKAAQAAKKKGAGGGAAQEDPFKDLNESQKKFAKYLVTLQPLIKDLKAAASGALLPILQDQIDRLVNGTKGTATFFEVIRNGIKRTSVGLGAGITKFVDALTSPKNLANLEAVFKGIQPVFETFGKVFGSLFGSFLTITRAAFPATRKFLTFIDSKTKTFENFLDTKAKSGELTAFFTRATKLAGDFGQIFGNIGGFIGDIIKSNFGPDSGGQYLVSVFKNATLNLRNLREEMGATKMDDYFYQASINARLILGLIGDMAKGLAALGASSDLQVAFSTLREVGPFMQKFLAEGTKLAPIMAEIAVEFSRFMAVFSESSNAITFFSVIKTAIKTVADIMQNQVVAAFVSFLTQIAAFKYGLVAVSTVFKFIFGKIILGGIVAAYKAVVTLIANMKLATAGALTMGQAMSKIGGPIVMALAAIAMGFVEIGNAAQRAREQQLGALDEINASARSAAYDGIDTLKTAFGEISGEVEYYTNYKGGIFDAVFDAGKITTDAETFKTSLNVMTSAWDGTQRYFAREGGLMGLGEMDPGTVAMGFKNLGTALSDVARTNLPEASRKFKDITTQFNLTDEEALRLLETMPDFKNVLRESASAANGLTGDQNLLNIAFGRGEDSANAVATQVYGVGGAAKAAKERIQGLKDEIFNFGSVTLDTRAAQREFERAIDDVTASVIQNGKGLDVTTEAGRNNSAALDALVTSGKDFANSMFEQNGNAAELQTNMENLRTKVKNAAEQMGLGKTAAEKLADQLVGSKYELNIKIKAITKEQVTTATAELKKIVTDAGKAGFRVTAADLARLYPELVAVAGASKRYGGYINTFGSGIRRFAPGGPVFGAGTGTSDSIPAMLSNGEFVVNANATAKNRSLLETINSGNQSVSGGNNISIVVNPGPGMDVKELASEVSRRLAFTMRKGAAI